VSGEQSLTSCFERFSKSISKHKAFIKHPVQIVIATLGKIGKALC
jgi:hypothetical protein